ncbi:MAG: hypothetical protein KatS3mg114_1201 [Planctomycetaceae bacterium]|nr:MAG: hypothetical protein KatS3mg114_1201 [Planctomycetaceae bacterium]
MSRTRWFWVMLTLWNCHGWDLVAWSQVILVSPGMPLPRPIPQPRPGERAYTLKSLQYDVQIQDLGATVVLTQTFANVGSRVLEAQAILPVPTEAGVDQVTLIVDGKEYSGQVLPASQARSRYEDIVRYSQDPALVEWFGHGLVQTSVFPIPPGGQSTVQVRYRQLLRRERGLTDLLLPLAAARFGSRPLEHLSVNIWLQANQDVKTVYAPGYDLKTERLNNRRIRVRHEQRDVSVLRDFRLWFVTGERRELSVELVSGRPHGEEAGYLMLMIEPPPPDAVQQELPKNLVLVIDCSGSMAGKKFQQAQAALKSIIQQLHPDDQFNIVAYETQVQQFQPTLQPVTDETRHQALQFVEQLQAQGGTNIHEALLTAFASLREDQRPSYVIFVTDGLPTVGEQRELMIADQATKANRVKARLLTMGVGYDVNSRLLERLARENQGQCEYVKPEEDLEVALSRVYQRIARPWMSRVTLHWQERNHSSINIHHMYPERLHDLYAGELQIILGRYHRSGTINLVLTGERNGTPWERTFEFELKAQPSVQATHLPALWASRRIGALLDQIDLHGKNEELIQELVNLSQRYGILTPYTSFLAEDRQAPSGLASRGNLLREAERRLNQLQVESGRDGIAARSMIRTFSQAPASEVLSGRYLNVADVDSKLGASIELRGMRKVGDETLWIRRNTFPGARRGKLALIAEADQLDLQEMWNQGKIRVVELFTRDYFALLTISTDAQRELLSHQRDDEELLLKLNQEWVLIRPSSN